MTLLIPHKKHLGLLSAAESRCFCVVRHYQRKQLLADTFGRSQFSWPKNVNRLTWSGHGGRFLLQCLVLTIFLPIYTLFQIIRMLGNLLLFPLRFIATYITPSGLHSPGEKNLVGLYGAYSQVVNLSPRLYIQCMEEWVPILYGAAKSGKYSLSTYVEQERDKQRNASRQGEGMVASFRSPHAVARERLSKDLGYYTGRLMI